MEAPTNNSHYFYTKAHRREIEKKMGICECSLFCISSYNLIKLVHKHCLNLWDTIQYEPVQISNTSGTLKRIFKKLYSTEFLSLENSVHLVRKETYIDCALVGPKCYWYRISSIQGHSIKNENGVQYIYISSTVHYFVGFLLPLK